MSVLLVKRNVLNDKGDAGLYNVCTGGIWGVMIVGEFVSMRSASQISC